jgi:hypothetical protein
MLKTQVKRGVRMPYQNTNAVTLLYQKDNQQAVKALDFMLSLGLFERQVDTVSPIREGLEDIKMGRITTVKNPANVIEECLKD